MNGLVVAEKFGRTFQGEGPSAGRQALFVRLGRCNLSCNWCDTPYTWDWKNYDPSAELHHEAVDETVSWVKANLADGVILVITGGEPLLQATNLARLVTALHGGVCRIEVETNGTRIPPSSLADNTTVSWNVSPKLANSGDPYNKRVVPATLEWFASHPRATFKFVVTNPGDLNEVGNLADAHGIAASHVWVMPEGRTPEAITGTARLICDHVLDRGWNLSLRTHVLLWGDERGR